MSLPRGSDAAASQPWPKGEAKKEETSPEEEERRQAERARLSQDQWLAAGRCPPETLTYIWLDGQD